MKNVRQEVLDMLHDPQEIDDYTCFRQGDKFKSEQQVRDYFSVPSFILMFDKSQFSQEELDKMAEAVIRNRWHFED